MVHGESLVNAQWLVGVGCVKKNGNVTILSQSIQGRRVKSKNWDQALKQSPVMQTLVQVSSNPDYVKDSFHKTTTKQQIFQGTEECRHWSTIYEATL